MPAMIAPYFYPLDKPVDLDQVMLDVDPDYVPQPAFDAELERQFQAELAATRDLEYAYAFKKLQFYLNDGAFLLPLLIPACHIDSAFSFEHPCGPCTACSTRQP